MRNIDKKETLRRMEMAVEEGMRNGEKAPDYRDLDDHDLVMVFGSLIAFETQGVEMDLRDIVKEIVRRAAEYTADMLEKENLIAYEGDEA